MKRFIINAASLALTLTLPLGASAALREAMAKDVANQVRAET